MTRKDMVGFFITVQQGEDFYEICQVVPAESDHYYLFDAEIGKLDYPLGFITDEKTALQSVDLMNQAIDLFDCCAFIPPDSSNGEWLTTRKAKAIIDEGIENDKSSS